MSDQGIELYVLFAVICLSPFTKSGFKKPFWWAIILTFPLYLPGIWFSDFILHDVDIGVFIWVANACTTLLLALFFKLWGRITSSDVYGQLNGIDKLLIVAAIPGCTWLTFRTLIAFGGG